MKRIRVVAIYGIDNPIPSPSGREGLGLLASSEKGSD
jgi:hypothetical protein